MKLGELFFEQVLIGLIVLTTAALPWVGDISRHLQVADVNTVLGLAGGTLSLAAAFLVGLVFDRVADSLTERLEVHNRLKFVFRNKLFEIGGAVASPKDPYPEDQYRLAALKLEKDLVVWINYHRSRIRVARAMMVYGPALTLAAVLGVGMSSATPLHPLWQLWWLSSAPLVYVLAAFALVKRDKQQALPKTYDHAGLVEYAKRHASLMRNRPYTGGTPWSSRVLFREPIVWCQAVLFALAFSLALQQGNREMACALWASLTVLTMLSGWTWWRISLTYRAYIRSAAHQSLPRGE